MLGKRLAAVVGAVLLVVAAVGVRRFIDSGGEVSLGGTPSPVYCDPLVADACRTSFDGREVIIEPPGRTLDRLLADREQPSLLWVTSTLWFDILESERARLGRQPLIENRSGALAHSELYLVAEPSVESTCSGSLSWGCLADAGNGLEIGFDSRQTSVGLLSQAALVGAFLGTPAYATNDLGASYGQWRSSLAGELQELSASRTALNELLTVRGRFDVVSTTQVGYEALARDGYVNARPADPGPPVAIAMASIGDAGGSSDDLASVLAASGWEQGEGPGRPAPNPGVYEALRQE